jgi:hypothetical protein
LHSPLRALARGKLKRPRSFVFAVPLFKRDGRKADVVIVFVFVSLAFADGKAALAGRKLEQPRRKNFFVFCFVVMPAKAGIHVVVFLSLQ